MRPNAQVKYVKPDGALTIEGLKFIDALAREIETLRAEVDALTVQGADHESRITALEP